MSGIRREDRRGIVCAGCWTLDRIRIIDGWPAEEELAHVLASDHQGGGSAHNVGINLCKLDPALPVEGIGLIGCDADGDFLVEQARRHGMNIDGLKRHAGLPTSFTEVMTVRDTGRRTFFHHPGTNDLLAADDIDLADSTARMLHLGLVGVHRRLDTPDVDGDNGWATVLKRARAAGIETNLELVSIDPARNRSLCRPCLPHLDYLIVNDHEIGGLADLPTLRDGDTDAAVCEQAARRVMAQGAMRLLVVHFPSGALALTRDGVVVRRPAVCVDPATVAGAVGAGDAFAAGMLYALHEGWSLEQALPLAHAVAAASLRSPTTVGSVMTVKECLALAGLDD